MKDKKRQTIITIIIIILLSLFIGLFIVIRTGDTTQNNSNGVVWERHNTQAVIGDTYYNKVDGFESYYFKADSLVQKVDFHNDEYNICKAEMSLMLPDGQVIWHEKDIMPGYGFYEIIINQKLEKGTYENCRLITRFYNLETGKAVNPHVCNFTLYVR